MEPIWKSKVQAQTARELRQRATPTERALWEVLRSRRLAGAKFRRQHRIGRFVVDFCCVEQHLVVEIDGPVHMRTQEADRERQRLIEEDGFRVIRIPTELIEQDLQVAFTKIRAALEP
ncbi:MAG: DUF559 domain-containing protein [Dehalococcoidia bacterium]